MRTSLCRCAVLIAAACLALPALAQQERVGVVTAVSADATGQAPHRSIARLAAGHYVFRKEIISTFGNGQVQLLFNDRSTLTLSENSAITIDDFILDPQTGASRLIVTVAVGLVRYNGKGPSNSSAQFITPSGAVNVEGGAGAVITVEDRAQPAAPPSAQSQ